MDQSETRDLLRQATAYIKAGEMDAARQLLRPLCEAGNADAWWLVAQTVTSPERIQEALRRALDIDPMHERAAKQLAQLFPQDREADLEAVLATEIDEASEPRVIKPMLRPRRKFKSKKRSRPVRWNLLVLVALGGIVVGAASWILYQMLTYTVAPPLLGPYYVRFIYDYPETPVPCNNFAFIGNVKDAPGMTVHFWGRSYDEQTTTDAIGDFHFIVSSAIYPPAADGTYDQWQEPFHMQIFDAQGKAQSGITDVGVADSCVIFYQFEAEKVSGRYLGMEPDERPAAWSGPYTASYSALTSSNLLICEFAGFFGTIYDDHGPVDGMIVKLTVINDVKDHVVSEWTVSGELAAQLVPSAWIITAKPEQSYRLDVYTAEGQHVLSDYVFMPSPTDCGHRLIKVSIMQSDSEATFDKRLLPPEWTG